MGKLRYLLVAAATVASLNACASANGQADSDSPAHSPTRLVVQNNNWLDVAIYVLNGSTRSRLGTVRSNATENFVVPRALISNMAPLVVQADPIGSSEKFTSDPIMIYPGARLEMNIGPNLRFSNYAVFSTQR